MSSRAKQCKQLIGAKFLHSCFVLCLNLDIHIVSDWFV